MDWQEIKMEYVTNPQVGYRELAEKYGVSLSTISKHAQKEGWKKEREKLAKKTSTKAVEKTAEKNAKRLARIGGAADKLLRKLEKVIAGCMAEDLLKSPKLIRALSGALKDLKDVLDAPTERDVREQEARIKKLEQEAMQAQKDSTSITVKLEGAAKEYGE